MIKYYGGRTFIGSAFVGSVVMITNDIEKFLQ